MLQDEDGEKFFNVIMIDLVCSACRRLPADKHKDCTHLDDTVLPPWKSKEKNKRAKIVQTVDPNVGRNARESMGLITGDYNQALDEQLVKKTMDAATRQYHQITSSPDRIYVAIDPDGGGRSRLSVVSGFICRGGEKTKNELPGTLVIIGIDFKQCDNDLAQDEVVAAHLTKIRSFLLFERVPIILIPENQSGFFHSRIERHFQNLPNCRTLHEYNQEKPGVRKDAHKTKEYVIRVNDMLKGGLIKFSTEWFTTTTKDFAVGKEFVIQELRDEMIRYCYDEHGKLTGKINGSQDDLYVAFAMLCYFGSVVESSTVYKEYRVSAV